MDIATVRDATLIVVALYVAFKARQAVQHLRVLRKNTTPKAKLKLSPEQQANWEALTGRPFEG